MPSVSPAQHRWVEWIAHNPGALAHSGMTQAKADEWAHADKGSPWKHRDTGGMVDPTSSPIGGIAPSAQTMNPQTQALVQRYSALPTEKLYELSAQLGATPEGQIVRKLLQQKQAMPQQGMQPAAAVRWNAAAAGVCWGRRSGDFAQHAESLVDTT